MVTKLHPVVRRFALPAAVLACLLVAGAIAAAPVLHEYFDASAVDVPRAVEGPKAQAGAADPDVSAPAQAAERSASSSGGPHASPEPGRYQLDANTSRPERVGYEDPFTPSIPPFKRLVAYDSVNSKLELVVQDRALRSIRVGGSPSPRDDQFFGDISVSVASDSPVRIPSVGPMTRVVAARLEPPGRFELFADSAENWFVAIPERGTRRLIAHLAIDRAVFGSAYGETTWERLRPHLPKLPNAVRDAAKPVLEELGLSRSVSPALALERMVRHFRSFSPSDERRSKTGPELYAEIALGQVGVCRHRAFAFVVTALALGIPSRFVHNEAHAWVEVFDGKLWHRIDLGGAAGDVSFGNALDVPHVPPPDPLAWPANSESGQQMVDDAVGQQQSAAGRAGGTSSAAAGSEGGTNSADSAAQPADTSPSATSIATPQPSAPDSPDALPPDPSVASVEEGVFAQVKLIVAQQAAVRGNRVAVAGRIVDTLQGCPLRKVRVMLRSDDGNVQPLGVLVTGERGRFEGQLVVPDSMPVGDYDLYVTSPAEGDCKPVNSLQDGRE